MTSRTDDARPLAASAPPARRRRLRRTTRLGLLAASVIALVGTGLQPATAASKPSQVGLVTFTAKSYSLSSKTTALTFSWPKARRATKYEVYISRYYSMSRAKKYTTRHRSKTVRGLRPGADYFVRVRAVNGSKRGSYSNRVGHTTIRRIGNSSGQTYRVMSYNVCSRVCSKWDARQSSAQYRVRGYMPDVLAAQEADNLVVPAGYTQAHYKSGKRLMFKTSRFTMEPGNPEGPEVLPPLDNRCTPTRSWGSYGEISLGYHGGGCRYAVWARLTDIASQRQTVFVNVHTVSGDNTPDARLRRDEIIEATKQVAAINVEGLPVVYAGDFNSHKNRSNDYLRTVFNAQGYYDAYDLAWTLKRQHNNSYNDFKVTPKISYKWGDHVDKVWMRPDQGRVLSWTNGALIKNDRMVTPIPSDHSPIIADVRIN